jgi:hypothetical protein
VRVPPVFGTAGMARRSLAICSPVLHRCANATAAFAVGQIAGHRFHQAL